MLSAIMLVAAVVALVHFGVYYWRALMLGVAAEELSPRMQSLAHGEAVGADDFRALACLEEMCPELERGSRRVGPVAAYYGTLSFLRATLGALVPGFSSWTSREMAACSRYVAVVTDQRLQRNLAQVAQIHSY